jgi:pimeloyl-ACP methyl ester carboxylesterase
MNATHVSVAQGATNSISTARIGRLAVLLAGVLLAWTSVTSNAMARSSSPHGSDLTIVLVHGGFAGPEGWDEVRAGLTKDGYTSAAPRLNLMDAAEDVATVRAALDQIPGKKILVGHSYGGFVVTQAAADRPDVVGLVYTAAFIPRPGDSLISLGTGYEPPAALQPGHAIFFGEPFASPAIIAPEYYREDFAGDLNPNLAAEFAAGQQPFNFLIFGQPAGATASLPSWYALSGKDRMIVPPLQRWMAERAGAQIIEFPAASHAGGYTHYATPFVKLIEEAAASLAG